MIQGVTLDAGGTLLEPWPSVGHVYAAVAAEHGCTDLSPEILNQQFGAAWHNRGDFRHSREEWAAMVDATFAGLVHPAPSGTFFPALYERFATTKAWRLYDDVLPALRQLKSQNLALGLISNWDDRLRPLLDQLGLLGFFSVVVISWDVGCAKPDPRLFQQAARQLQLDPAHILHVGDDEEDDFHGAKAGGFQARLLDRGSGGSSKRSIATLTEILELVQK